jgi:glycerate kinase
VRRAEYDVSLVPMSDGGEGRFDAGSLQGKVVGGVLGLA